MMHRLLCSWLECSLAMIEQMFCKLHSWTKEVFYEPYSWTQEVLLKLWYRYAVASLLGVICRIHGVCLMQELVYSLLYSLHCVPAWGMVFCLRQHGRSFVIFWSGLLVAKATRTFTLVLRQRPGLFCLLAKSKLRPTGLRFSKSEK